MTTNEYHFYASNTYQWATTDEGRDLRGLLKLMDKKGDSYDLFLVPLPHNEGYEISGFQPMVKGTQFLGRYDVKETP
jgi:hypothetical protein